MFVYFNYPNKQITLHHDAQCVEIQKKKKPGQRVVSVTMESLPQVITDFIAKKYSFASTQVDNDLWLHVALNSRDQEETLVPLIQALLSQHYSRFAKVSANAHC